MQRLVSLSWLFLLVCYPLLAAAAEPVFPELTGRVVDQASLLSPEQRNFLTGLLKQHEEETSNQVVVVTLKSLQGYSIEEFGYQLGRHWGIGQKQRNNGVLLIVAPNERKVRIEVGYGLEGVLTDFLANDIIQSKILPYFKQNQYPLGIEAGVAAIIDVLKGSYSPIKRQKSEHLSVLKIITLIIVAAFIDIVLIDYHMKRRLIASGIFAVLTFVVTMILIDSLLFSSIFSFLTFFFYSLLSDYLRQESPSLTRYEKSYWYDDRFGGGGGGFGSGGGFGGGGHSSGGGFSGGGGSFGGGGSSGSW
jgi:uncharacterized protein